MTSPLGLTIVVVTYQRQSLLQLLLDSLAGLQIPPAHIVVVDNESSDETKKIVNALAARLDQTTVHYHPLEQNAGGAGGFSVGVEAALQLDAEWLWLMDDDVKVLPEATAILAPWLARAVANDTRVLQVGRRDVNGRDFYWQSDFNTAFGIPNPLSPARFKVGKKSHVINTMCFEGGIVHRSIVDEIGLPDARFFIYWDDTIYGYLASKHTKPILIDERLIQRTRSLNSIRIGRIRRLNETSDMTRYYIMRNRGYMAQYFKWNGDYQPVLFGIGTVITLAKEIIRLRLSDDRRYGLHQLLDGLRDSRPLMRDKTWKPMPTVGA